MKLLKNERGDPLGMLLTQHERPLLSLFRSLGKFDCAGKIAKRFSGTDLLSAFFLCMHGNRLVGVLFFGEPSFFLECFTMMKNTVYKNQICLIFFFRRFF